MPELPEVEVVKRSLEKNINNLIIKKVTINTNKLRYIIQKKEIDRIIKKKILSVKRRSKYLIIKLNNNNSILVHLGMTGKFIILNKEGKKKKTSFYYQLSEKDEKHNHIIFYLSKNIKLIYNDVRKFGFIKIVSSNKINNISHLSLLGPEPLSKNFDFEYFKKYIFNKNKKIKDIMMDQKFISGLGNIYVNEILFISKISPKTKAKNLSNLNIKKIIKVTKKILNISIKKGGSSIKNFKNSFGQEGSFQQKFKVYSRQGKKCMKNECSGTIKKITISNRSTFYCESCQK